MCDTDEGGIWTLDVVGASPLDVPDWFGSRWSAITRRQGRDEPSEESRRCATVPSLSAFLDRGREAVHKTMILDKRLIETVSRTFDLDPSQISAQTAPNNTPAWDSVGHLNLILELEEVFQIRFSSDEDPRSEFCGAPPGGDRSSQRLIRLMTPALTFLPAIASRHRRTSAPAVSAGGRAPAAVAPSGSRWDRGLRSDGPCRPRISACRVGRWVSICFSHSAVFL